MQNLLFLFICFVAVFFILALWVYLRGNQDWQRIQALTGAGSLLVSFVAIVVSGYAAFTGTKISEQSLKLSERQDIRDQIGFFAEKAEQTFGLYSDLLFAVSRLYAHSILIANQPVGPETNVPEPDPDSFVSRVQKVTDALEGIGKNDFAYYCYRESALQQEREGKSVLAAMVKKLKEHGEPSTRYETFRVSNLVETANSLENGAKHVKSDPKRISTARGMANYIKSEAEGNLSNPAMYFLFLGNLIFPHVEENKKVIASPGTAYFYDLVQSVPDGGFIRQCLIGRYEEAEEVMEGNKYRFHFNPEYVYSATLQEAIQDISGVPLVISTGSL